MSVYEDLRSDIRDTLAAFHPEHEETPLAIEIAATSIMRLIEAHLNPEVGAKQARKRA